MNTSLQYLRKLILTILLSMMLGALFILAIGENPLDAYISLFRGAFDGKLHFGTTLAGFTPLLLTSAAFCVAAEAGAFNVGVEGEVFLGGIVAAYIGIHWTFLPPALQLLACFAGAMLVAALWAWIPAALRVYLQVSEVCTTILMNSVALQITSYLVSGPMSAGKANAQSDDVYVVLDKWLKPSNVNTGLFLAAGIVIAVIWMLKKTRLGYEIRQVGKNPYHADYIGISSGKTFITAMMLSGMLGGIAGCIEVLGVHGYFLNNFAAGLGSNGMLAALIAQSNIVLAPFMSFFLAVLTSGALGMQQATGVPKALVDSITAIFIVIATMDTLFAWKRKRVLRKAQKVDPAAEDRKEGEK